LSCVKLTASVSATTHSGNNSNPKPNNALKPGSDFPQLPLKPTLFGR
jgi:hypothetical protein